MFVYDDEFKERYFNHKAAGRLSNIRGGSNNWLVKTPTTESIYKAARLLSELMIEHCGYVKGADLIKEIHDLCMSLPDDDQKYTAILKRDAARLLELYEHFEQQSKDAFDMIMKERAEEEE